MLVNRFNDVFSLEKKLQTNWERFHSEGILSDGLRDYIISSWERCNLYKVDPLIQEAKRAYSDFSILEKKEQYSYLLDIVTPYLDEIAQCFSDDNMAVVLTDHHGMIIEEKAGEKTWRRLSNLGLEPGADWSEEITGTNAIGTALKEGKPVQVFSAEHFCQGWHP